MVTLIDYPYTDEQAREYEWRITGWIRQSDGWVFAEGDKVILEDPETIFKLGLTVWDQKKGILNIISFFLIFSLYLYIGL